VVHGEDEHDGATYPDLSRFLDDALRERESCLRYPFGARPTLATDDSKHVIHVIFLYA
jgi:hypothetical protein